MILRVDKINFEGKIFDAWSIPTQNGNLLLIKSARGILGCGYLNAATADKINDALAIVSGVKNYGDMLEAKVLQASRAALALGVETGMSGAEALLKMS